MAEAGPASRATAGRRSSELFAEACRVIPGGVDSPVRAFGSVGGSPYFVARAEGAFVEDVDGRRLLDYVQSWGASILGHAHPAVLEAIAEAAARGTTYGAPTEGEVRLAEAITEAVPGCDQVRLVSSGTEAAMTVIRLARGATGRDRVVKFAGCYHGHSDALLAGGGSGVATLGLPDSAGVPQSAVSATLVAPYNEVPEIDESVACVIVEPVAANMGLVAPVAGFLEGLRAACDRAGALLIFDEVITGFRVGRAGATGAARRAAGPVVLREGDRGGPAARRARRPARAHVAAGPARARLPGGHLVGQPARDRGRARRARAPGRGGLRRAGGERRAARRRARPRPSARAGSRSQVPVFGTLFSVFFSDEPVRDYEGAARAAAVRALRPVLPGHARPRRRARPEPVRDRLRVAGALGRGHRPHGRGGRRGGPGGRRGSGCLSARGSDGPGRRRPCRRPRPARARRAAGSSPMIRSSHSMTGRLYMPVLTQTRISPGRESTPMKARATR